MTNGTAPTVSLRQKRRAELEQIIERGFKTFVEVAHALAEMRDEKLYLDTHETFEAYCQDRWKFSRQYAYRLLSAAQVAVNVSTIVDIPNVEIARELGRLESPQDQRTAATIAVATAPEGKLTAEWMAGTVDVFQDAMATDGLVNTGTGDYAALNAAITNEVHQTMMDKRNQLKQKRTKPDAVFECAAGNVAAELTKAGIDDSEMVRVVVYRTVTQ